MYGISNTYYEIWINDVRIMVQPDLEARGSIFDVSIAHFKTANGHSFQPDGARSNPLFIRKHYLENGKVAVHATAEPQRQGRRRHPCQQGSRLHPQADPAQRQARRPCRERQHRQRNRLGRSLSTGFEAGRKAPPFAVFEPAAGLRLEKRALRGRRSGDRRRTGPPAPPDSSWIRVVQSKSPGCHRVLLVRVLRLSACPG